MAMADFLTKLVAPLRAALGGAHAQGQTDHTQQEEVAAGGGADAPPRRLLVLYGSGGGTCERLASALAAAAEARGVPSEARRAEGFEPESLERAGAGEQALALVLPTYAGGTPPPDAAWLCRWLEEAAVDERRSADSLSLVWAAVYAVGDTAYGEDFAVVGRGAHAHLRALGARPLAPLGLGDVGDGEGFEAAFERWAARVADVVAGRRPAPRGGRRRADAEGTEEEEEEGAKGDEAAAAEADDADEDAEAALAAGLGDLEDLGAAVRKSVAGGDEGQKPRPRMVTPLVHKSLTKQGYKVVGSHSGVKLCRWTKSMLRGRGGCYKHAFYGIASHCCMETTPSLACSSKCTFCWRHHSNPVGRSWKWDMDAPDELVAGVLEQHRKMIREFGGVPGVRPERLKEALEVRHCALSLVGEPIMYPEINAFVGELHARNISSFLVNNAQHPDQLENLRPITQLYVSIDAATKDELRAIDRPIFGDFWERMLRCLDIIRDKKQRTVFRLTLVKGYNADDVNAYAKLVHIGRPSMIELKGVTYCGSSGASDLSIKNCPRHEEVKRFAEDLCAACGSVQVTEQAEQAAGDAEAQQQKPNGCDDETAGALAYGMAAEHAHSCCVLVAHRNTFYRDGRWHTWIDYPKFQQLAATGRDDFGAEEYMLETPAWAAYDSAEAGFAPGETRFKKVRRHKSKEEKEAAAAGAQAPAAQAM